MFHAHLCLLQQDWLRLPAVVERPLSMGSQPNWAGGLPRDSKVKSCVLRCALLLKAIALHSSIKL